MKNYNSGESFINYIYQELINTDEVKKAIERRGVNPKNRDEAVRYYMERMENSHNTQRKIDILKKFYYRKYVIDHLPESYVEMQWRIAREQGRGNIRVTDEIKRKMLEEIQIEQMRSLDRWLDYLNSEDAMYPMWFKYYAFQGMLKLGQFDKEKRKFRKRTNDTTSPFIEVNPEALGQMYTILLKIIGKKELTEDETKSLENGQSFQKLYTSLLSQIEEKRVIESTGTEGKWVKYEQGDNYLGLLKSLQGKNTGWCTAGGEMCKRQIRNGDFYVYYTYDKDGNPVEPRVAIRMNGHNEIAEVRGIGKDQNLEPEMIEIADKKLAEFEVKKYYKKVNDMNLLTKIERKTNNNEELTQDEIIFLYEFNSKIEGFGWRKDPRIEEIIARRNPQNDIAKVDTESIKIGLHNNPPILKYIPTNYPNYEELVVSAIQKKSFISHYLPNDFKFTNPEIALEAVRIYGEALKYVPRTMTNYEELALEAVKTTPIAIKYVSQDIPDYEELLLSAIQKKPFISHYLPNDFKFTNPEIALEAVRIDGKALKYVPRTMTNYEELALEAVKTTPNAIKYVSQDISDYEKLVLKAVKKDSMASGVLSDDFKFTNPKIALEAVKVYGNMLKFVPSAIPNYEEMALRAVERNPEAIKYVSKDIPNYEEVLFMSKERQKELEDYLNYVEFDETLLDDIYHR